MAHDNAIVGDKADALILAGPAVLEAPIGSGAGRASTPLPALALSTAGPARDAGSMVCDFGSPAPSSAAAAALRGLRDRSPADNAALSAVALGHSRLRGAAPFTERHSVQAGNLGRTGIWAPEGPWLR